MEEGCIFHPYVPSSDFSEFSRSWQQRFHISMIVKCLERSVQSVSWSDFDVDRWYLVPNDNGRFMSEEAAEMFASSLPLFAESNEQTRPFLMQLIAFNDINEVFLKPMLKVCFLYCCVCPDYTNLFRSPL